jgi:ribosomal protein L40E
MSKISKERKITYYIGNGMMVLGLILFISVFFSFSSAMNKPFSGPPSFSNAIIGIVLIISGAIVSNIGAKGVAGSGLKLDPEEAREDLKPFNEAKGEMINDVISNIDAVSHITKSQAPKEIIKVRCRNCNGLNDEDAKFCKSCGSSL